MAVAAVIARKLLPRLYRERACSELEELITRVLAGIGDQPKATVRIAPALVDELAPLIEALIAARGHDQRLTILGDPAIQEFDCRIDWPGGGVIRDEGLLWQEIDALLCECVGHGPPPSPSLPSVADGTGAAACLKIETSNSVRSTIRMRPPGGAARLASGPPIPPMPPQRAGPRGGL